MQVNCNSLEFLGRLLIEARLLLLGEVAIASKLFLLSFIKQTIKETVFFYKNR